MKVVVLTGPESTGKSALAARLHGLHGGLLCGEYVRQFIDDHQRDTTMADIPAIALGQLAQEDQARAQCPAWLWLDTHLLSNVLWCEVLFGEPPPWLEQALRSRRYDLHLLLSPEGAPWVPDPQRCQPSLADRRAFFNACRQWLDENGQAYAVLEGTWADRATQADAAIRRHFT
jgi:NadR type nicotinamide-nucleotide adenylyltransferase